MYTSNTNDINYSPNSCIPWNGSERLQIIAERQIIINKYVNKSTSKLIAQYVKGSTTHMYCNFTKFERISACGYIMKLPSMNKQPNGTITSHKSDIFDSEYPTRRNSVIGASRGQFDIDIEYSSFNNTLAIVFVIKFTEIGEL